MKPDFLIIRDMFAYCTNRMNQIMHDQKIIDDTITFKDSFKASTAALMETRYKELLQMVITLKTRRNIPQGSPFNVQQLKDLHITEGEFGE